MRVLLITGKGGVGKTSVAAATALRAADSGARTLVLSTDPAHSLADALDLPLSGSPREVAPNLAAAQLDARAEMESNWREIRRYLVALLAWSGLDAVEAEELAILPGLEELFALADVARRARDGSHDLVVVDCAPTGETIRLLSLPDVLRWYLERVFPLGRKMAAAVRPVLGHLGAVPLPGEAMFESVERLHRHLDGVRQLLVDPDVTSVRLVVNPEKLVVAEAKRTATSLALFGYHVDAVLVNRVLGEEVTDPFFARWKAIQRDHLTEIEEGFAPLPILRAPLFDDELVGPEALRRLGAVLWADIDPTAVLHRGAHLRLDRDGNEHRLTLPLPFAASGEVDLLRRHDELVVRIGAHTRSIALPAALNQAVVAGATVRDGKLVVRFAEPVAEPGTDPASGPRRAAG